MCSGRGLYQAVALPGAWICNCKRYDRAMPTIDISRAHSLPAPQARATIDQVAAALRTRFALQSAWRGDVLHFRRGGVEGGITLEVGQVHIHAELGLLLGFMQPTIEAEIRRQLDQHFGAAI